MKRLEVNLEVEEALEEVKIDRETVFGLQALRVKLPSFVHGYSAAL